MCFDGYNIRCCNEGEHYMCNINFCEEKNYDVMLQVHRNSNHDMNMLVLGKWKHCTHLLPFIGCKLHQNNVHLGP